MADTPWFPPAPAARRPRFATLGPLTDAGLLLATLILFAVSGGLLWHLGYNYDGLLGSAATKIHPSTYLITLLFGWSVIVSGDPVRRLAYLASARPASLFMALVAVLVLTVFVVRGAPGMAGLLDTFFAPALLVMLLADSDERTLARMEVIIHVVLAVNALLGLYEFATKNLLFPYRLEDVFFDYDLRSTALQGHPLTNATVTACYLMALMTGTRSLPDKIRFALIALQAAGLVSFGGRTAMLSVLVFGGGYGLWALLRQLRSRRVSLLGAAIAVMVLTIVPFVIGGLWVGGFFDLLLSRFVSDGGSANARKEMFELVYALPLRDLIIGPDIEWVESLRRINGLEWGIENPLVKLIVYQGVLVALLLTIAFVLFMAEIARHCRPGIWLPMIVWIILLNSAETIGGKTTMPGKFAVLLLCLYRPPPAAAGLSRAAWSARAR